MKKVLALILALSMIFALCAVSASAEEKEKKVKLTLGTTSAADDIQTQVLEEFAANVKEKSNGSIEISVYPASMLGDATAEFDSTIAGTQDMFMESESGYYDQYGVHEAVTLGLGCAMTTDQAITFSNSDFMKNCRDSFREQNGLVTLGYNWYRNQIVVASKEKLENLDDIKGVKLRAVPSEQTVKCYGALGFQCTTIAYNEVYLSLSQGVVDATMCPFDGYYTMKFYEVAPYCLEFGSVTNNALWMNEAKFNTLSDNQKQILMDCCAEAGEVYTQRVADVRADYQAQCEAAGCEFIPCSDELLNQCLDIFAEQAYAMEAEGYMPVGTFDEAKAQSLGEK